MMMFGDEPIPTEWTPNTGATKRPLTRGMLVRMRKAGRGEERLLAVSKATNSSVTLVPVALGGWSEGSGEVISPMSEVDYRKDEGAPYDNERYGAFVGAKVSVVTAARKVVAAEREEVMAQDETGAEVEVGVKPSSKVSAPPVRVSKTKVKAKDVSVTKVVEDEETEEEEEVATKPAETKTFRTGSKGKGVKKAAAKKSPLSARVTPKAKKAKVEEVEEESTSPYVYTLAEAAEQAEVPASRVNALRRAGLLPKRGGWEQQGRAVMYSQKAVDAIVKLQEKGVKIPAATAGTAAPAKRGRKPRRTSAAVVGDPTESLRATAEQYDALATKYANLAERTRELLAEIEG